VEVSVTAASTEDKVTFTVTQGSAEVTQDISGAYTEVVDMTGFAEGEVAMEIIFDNAKNVAVTIS
jgi:hypothetical protein